MTFFVYFQADVRASLSGRHCLSNIAHLTHAPCAWQQNSLLLPFLSYPPLQIATLLLLRGGVSMLRGVEALAPRPQPFSSDPHTHTLCKNCNFIMSSTTYKLVIWVLEARYVWARWCGAAGAGRVTSPPKVWYLRGQTGAHSAETNHKLTTSSLLLRTYFIINRESP
jgi:hypothetical protein